MQRIKGDTLFCFTIPQARTIAKRLESGHFADSINTRLHLENNRLHLVVNTQEGAMALLQKQLLNKDALLKGESQRIILLNQTITSQQKALKTKRFQFKLLVATVGVTGFVALIK